MSNLRTAPEKTVNDIFNTFRSEKRALKSGKTYSIIENKIYYFKNKTVDQPIINLNKNVMKKMNRSQSSCRPIKTFLTQACEANLLNKYASRNILARNQVAVTQNDMQGNKENNSMFQSISQRNLTSKSDQQISEFDLGQDLKKKVYKKDNDISKEEDMIRSRLQRQYFTKNNEGMNITKGYQPSSSDYQSQIESLREMIRQKDRELQCYMLESSSKSDNLDSIVEEMSSKNQRDYKEKNMYIRQLNATVIQKNSLQERLKIHRAEIQTLKLCINQKDKTLKQYEQKLGQVDMKKKKVEHYDYQIKEYHQMLKQLELRTQKLKEQTQRKDYIIQEKRKSIAQMQQTLGSYEDKLRSIQESLIRISQDKKIISQKNEELIRECSDWKKNYDQQLKKNEMIQDYEIKIKTYQQKLEEAGRKIMELTSQNEKYKITFTTNQKALDKYRQIEREISIFKKDIKEKNQKIIQLQAKQRSLKQSQESLQKVKKQKQDFTIKFQQKVKQCKSINLQLEQQKNRANCLQEQLREIEQNNTRMKQRGEKMQILMKQNNRLTSNLHQKIDQIEKLQIRINNMDIKLNDKSNEILKMKDIIYENEQEINEVKLEVQDLRERYQIQTKNRISNQDKLLRCTQQIFAQKSTITKMETQNKQMIEKMQQLNLDHLSVVNSYKDTLSEMLQDKNQRQLLLQQASLKIQFMQSETQGCKSQLLQFQRNQKQQKNITIKLEEQLGYLKEHNKALKQEKDQMIQKCKQLKQIYDFVMSFKEK